MARKTLVILFFVAVSMATVLCYPQKTEHEVPSPVQHEDLESEQPSELKRKISLGHKTNFPVEIGDLEPEQLSELHRKISLGHETEFLDETEDLEPEQLSELHRKISLGHETEFLDEPESIKPTQPTEREQETSPQPTNEDDDGESHVSSIEVEVDSKDLENDSLETME